MADMTALRAHHRGGPEVLVVERAPIPVPAAQAKFSSRFTPAPSPSTS